MSDKILVLGIDIGTTSVKVCIVDVNTGNVVSKQSKDTQANVQSDLGAEGNKQDVPKIISALHACVSRLPKDLLKQVTKIGICGQMHGVLLWKKKESGHAWERVEREDGTLMRYDVTRDNVSALYTWQDSRCEPEFLSTLPKVQSHLSVYTGYGCSTLFWFTKNKPEKLSKYSYAGTIQDFAVAMLCNLEKPIMSVQNAASWGYFDCSKNEWNKDILEKVNFPVHFLPNVIKNGSIAGTLADNWYGIPNGTPVGAALGDLQCSVLATIENQNDAVLNISTSAQLCFVANDFQPTETKLEDSKSIEYFPYFNDKYLAVAASLNGGNCLATFVRMLQQWSMDLGFAVPQSKVWEKVIALASDDNTVSSLQIIPTLLGERQNPKQNASVHNIDLSNISLGQVFRSLCHGVISNLHDMMPKDILSAAKIERIVGNGSGLSRNKVLQIEIQNLYKLPLSFTSGGDAARGAALAVTL